MASRISLKTYRLVLFDVDQTLLDFHASERKGILRLWEFCFQDVVDYREFSQEYHALNQVVWKEVEAGIILPKDVRKIRGIRVLEHFGLDANLWEQSSEVFLQGLASVAVWLPNGEDCFHRICNTHQVGFVTNGLVDVQYPRTQKLNIQQCLATYQISQEVGFTKPDPRIFELAMDDVGVGPDDVLYVGDSLTSDFQGALNAGIDFCWYNPEGISLPAEYPNPKFEISDLNQL